MVSELNAPLPCTELQPFGLVVTGFKVAQINVEFANHLRNWLGLHGVVVLRGAFAAAKTLDQAERDAAFVRFLEHLGPMTFTSGETPVAHQPMLNLVSNVGRMTPPKSVFHTDTSYVSSPPAYTALRAVAVPEAGGDTVFVNQYAAYDTLPPAAQQRLANSIIVEVLHSVFVAR